MAETKKEEEETYPKFVLWSAEEEKEAEKRSIRVSASQHFSGAWVDDQRYWERIECNDAFYQPALHLKMVCWLEARVKRDGVLPGRYEVVWKIRLDNELNFRAEWIVSTQNCGAARDWDEDERSLKEVYGDVIRFRNTHNYPAKLCSMVGHGWVFVKQGILQVKQTSTVAFDLGGGNPYWCRGLWIDYVELRPLGLSWDIKRLLLLGHNDQREYDERSNFGKLNAALILRIISFLSTPSGQHSHGRAG